MVRADDIETAHNAMRRTGRDDSVMSEPLILFLCGDVMPGRGIDQVLSHPCDPRLYEPYVRDARYYVELAERVNGPIPQPVDFSYVWGDALAELERRAPDVRIINLETAVTRSNDYSRNKGINYRMSPQNLPCLTAAGIDACALANNHVLDWGYTGLDETLEALEEAHIKTAGAGRDAAQAAAPALLKTRGTGRVIMFSFGLENSGIPSRWAASEDKPGINLLGELTDVIVRRIKEDVERVKRAGDIAVASIHWGSNWGYAIDPEEREFAHGLIDQAGIDVIHGHSSHHFKGIEVYLEKPILYGCGDFLDDYEGIGGYEEFRSDLVLMYFVSMERRTGRLGDLKMVPMRIKRFRLHRISEQDARWLRARMNRECARLGSRVELGADNVLTLKWGER